MRTEPVNFVRNPLTLLVSIFALSAVAASATAFAQNASEKKPPSPGPMLDQGIEDYDTPDFALSLVRSSQTAAALKPKGADGFDFTPGDLWFGAHRMDFSISVI